MEQSHECLRFVLEQEMEHAPGFPEAKLKPSASENRANGTHPKASWRGKVDRWVPESDK